MPKPISTLIIERFRWIDGHADVAGLLGDGEILGQLGAGLAELFGDEEVDLVAAPEARGFVVGALVARELGCGLVLIRKPGSVHPGECVSVRSGVDWRGNQPEFRLRVGDVAEGQRVLMVDDWVETGSQMRACSSLVERAGGAVVGVAAVVCDCTEALSAELNLRALVRVEELV